MRVFGALIKREILDGQNGYIRVPLILAAISLVLVIASALGFAKMDATQFYNVGSTVTIASGDMDSIVHENSSFEPEIQSAVAVISYWAFGALPWIALPFVVFFSLLGSLYEERRDRSILFWKSMPVSDTKEILARFVTPVLIGPFVFMIIIMGLQLAIALIETLAVLTKGSDIAALWPVTLYAQSWLSVIAFYLLWVLWALPILAWVMFVSSFAPRMPFVWAVLPPFVIMIAENLFFQSELFTHWFLKHLGGWKTEVFQNAESHVGKAGGSVLTFVQSLTWDAIALSFTNLQLWLGILLAIGLLFGASALRKRQI